MNSMIKFLGCLFLLFISSSYGYSPKQGDIIFQTSKSPQSLAIQKATKSPYSHMGIVLFNNNQPYVYEASNVVKFTPLEKWIKQGKSGKYVVKRMNGLTDKQEAILYKEAMKYRAKPYDLYFSWSDEKIYCSELVWKIYFNGLNIKIGKLQKMKDFDLSSEIVKSKLTERYGKNIPLDEVVISPNAIFESPLLTTIFEN